MAEQDKIRSVEEFDDIVNPGNEGARERWIKDENFIVSIDENGNRIPYWGGSGNNFLYKEITITAAELIAGGFML